MGDIKLMYKQITQLALKKDTANQNTDLVNVKARKKQMRKPLKNKNDIRLIVERGMKENLTTEEALTKAGVIKSCDEFLLHL